MIIRLHMWLAKQTGEVRNLLNHLEEVKIVGLRRYELEFSKVLYAHHVTSATYLCFVFSSFYEECCLEKCLKDVFL